MELIEKTKTDKLKDFIFKVYRDNLFLLSSSISYYSALAIAPFLLILLGVAAFLGRNVRDKVIALSYDFSFDVGQMISLIFANVGEGVNVGSMSGLIGIGILLFTASLVFMQMRYSLNVIYELQDAVSNLSIWAIILERLFAMFAVIVAGIFIIVSASLPGLVQFFREDENYLTYRLIAFLINWLIYVAMFWLIHYFTPSKHPGKREALKMSILSSLFFIAGNYLVGIYLKNVASTSIYGAAGTVIVFLIWTYYSSFTMFLSVELFLFFKKIGKIR